LKLERGYFSNHSTPSRSRHLPTGYKACPATKFQNLLMKTSLRIPHGAWNSETGGSNSSCTAAHSWSLSHACSSKGRSCRLLCLWPQEPGGAGFLFSLCLLRELPDLLRSKFMGLGRSSFPQKTGSRSFAKKNLRPRRGSLSDFADV